MAGEMTQPRRGPTIPLALIIACFFGSGLTGLIYEILWTRRLGLTFGSTTFSVTTVLAAFMAGLGIGSYLIGRRADRSKLGGLRIYAYLELAIGIYALASLPLLSLVESIYAGLQSSMELGQGGATLLKLVLSFPVLTFPAALMGGTLPVLVRHVTRKRAELHSVVGRLYGVNTAGAAIGTALAGMLMIEHLGLWRSMIVAATVNLIIAAVVLWRVGARPKQEAEPEASAERRQEQEREPEPDAEPRPEPARGLTIRDHLRSGPVLFCGIAVIMTGFLSMLYEVIWTRLLSLVMGSSTYAFTIVLSIFLVGIALGALIYSRASRERPPTAFGLTLVLLALAMWVTISIAVIPKLPYLMIRLAQIPVVSFERMLTFEVLFALFILLVPTLLLGVALPMSIGIISRAMGQVGRDVGGVYLVNTLGAIGGSVLTGFVFIPVWGTQNTLLGGLLANLILVALGTLAFGGSTLRKALGVALVALVGALSLSQPPWPPIVFDSGLGFRLDLAQAQDEAELMRLLYRAPNKLLHREEGRNATISVRRFGMGVTLMVNGKPDASTSGDMATQAVLGIVATMAHPKPVDVGIVGWGSGVTAYTATFFPTVKQVDVIEIEPAVLRASPYFHLVNGKAELNPRVKVIYDDARSQFLTSNRDYDVVISEPSNPWMVGVSGLFSRDYYELSKRRLKPGGVFGQWLQLYRIDARSVALILRTLMGSFKHVQLWVSDPFNVILLASDRPIRFNYERVKRVYKHSRPMRLHMEVYGPGNQPEHFFGCYMLGHEALKKVVARYPYEVMTDDRPMLEYRAIRGLYNPVHHHLKDLWRAKAALNQVLPPTVGTPPPAALAAVGAAAIVKGSSDLSRSATSWALKHYRDEPQVRLARAKVLLLANRPQKVVEMLKTLPTTPGYVAEAALVTGQMMLRLGKPREAFETLKNMRHFRPTMRAWYQLRAMMAMRRFDEAWPLAETLSSRLADRSDMDALRIQRHRFYRTINFLGRRSRAYSRALNLLNSRKEPHGGEVDRLGALVEIYQAAKQHDQAARVMDELLLYQIVKPKVLRVCEEVYRSVKDDAAADACRDRRLRLAPKPAQPPLWPDPNPG
jgi:spermidine synthase